MPSALAWNFVIKSTINAREREPVVQFSVFTPNRFGRLHDVVRRLAEGEVHILALTVLDTTDSTILRLVVDDPDRARSLLGEFGYAFSECILLVVEVLYEHQLKDILAAFIEAELNIHYIYPFLIRPGGRSAIAINVEHLDVAEVALKQRQFTVLTQDDLAR